jgi:hypothetical protein
MSPKKIESFIDNKIDELLKRGEGFEFVISYLSDKIKSFSSREAFIRVSHRYLIKNWDVINYKKKYTTYYVYFCMKRIEDLKWLYNSKLIDKYNESTCFQLIKFKENLNNTKTINEN